MKVEKCQPVLFVKNALLSAEFYTKALGFNVIMNNGDANIAFREGFAIWQIWEENVISQTIGSENIVDNKLPSRFELCFETDNLDLVYNTLKTNNVRFLHEINTEIWGQRTVRFYDPDGHLIEIGEAMPIFLKRIYDEENGNLESTAKRTFMPIDALKHFINQ